jgi:hypothetical protein
MRKHNLQLTERPLREENPNKEKRRKPPPKPLDELKDMKTQLEKDMKAQIEKAVGEIIGKASRMVNDLVLRTNFPFTQEVAMFPLPPRLKIPHLSTFNKMRDPLDHLEVYKSYMQLQVVPDLIMYSRRTSARLVQ